MRMKNELKGFMKIFHFTFLQQTKRKSWLISTVLVAALCFMVPLSVFSAIAWFGQDDDAPVPETAPESVSETAAVDMSALKQILVVNMTGEDGYSAESFREELGNMLEGVQFAEYENRLEQARIDSRGSGHMLVLTAEKEGEHYVLNLLLPEESTLPDGIIDQAAAVFSSYKSAAELPEMTEPSEVPMEHLEQEESVNPADGIREILGFAIPYLNIMLLYFFVLFYGQGVAQSVITEKSSKLMDFFLISVKPSAMILGKLTAVCLCGIIQLGSWIISLILGVVCGSLAASSIASDTNGMEVLQIVSSLGDAAAGIFQVSGIAMMLLLIMAGMFLYCSLAAVGGALAGKPEDLSSTNVLFTLILVVSFFTCLAAGGLSGFDGGGAWLDWIPFTAIMVTPARILLGSVSALRGAASLLLVIGTTLAVTIVAGRLYRMMALYKGDVPGPKAILKMMRSK